MATIKRRTDERGRLTLGNAFANQTVLIEQVAEGELRIRRAKPKVRFSLAELLAGITPDNIHPETDTGAPVGKEVF